MIFITTDWWSKLTGYVQWVMYSNASILCVVWLEHNYNCVKEKQNLAEDPPELIVGSNGRFWAVKESKHESINLKNLMMIFDSVCEWLPTLG